MESRSLVYCFFLKIIISEHVFPSYLSFLRSPIGKGLTEIRGKVEMEPCDWLLANEEVSRLRGDCGGVMRLGLLHSEWEREPGFRGRGGVRGRISV